MERVWTDYRDDDGGGLFDTARGRAAEAGLLPARAKPVQDTPTPSPNGVAGIVCARLTSSPAPRGGSGGKALSRPSPAAPRSSDSMRATYLLALDWQLNPATHLVIVGDRRRPAAEAMHRAALAGFVPRRVVQRDPAAGADRSAGAEGMLPAGRSRAGYACSGDVLQPAGRRSSSWQAMLAALRRWCRRTAMLD